MNTNDHKKSIDLTNGRVVSGMVCASIVPSVIFIILAIAESHDVYSFNYVMYAVLSVVPGFLSIFIPCFVLLWIGKTKPGWFVIVPPCVIVPQVLLFSPYQEFIKISPVTTTIAMTIAAFSGLLCWFISVRLDPKFESD